MARPFSQKSRILLRMVEIYYEWSRYVTNGRDILREIEIIFSSRFSRQVENFMMTGHAFILNGQNVHDDV